MKSTFLILVLSSPAFLFGQSLAEVAKKEKERREKNKEQGKEVQVLSEEDLARNRPPSATDETGEGEASPSAPAAPLGGTGSGTEDGYGDGEEEGDVPTFIPPDLPLPERLAMFERMKRHYLSQAKEIDTQIAENDTRIQKVQADLAAASALGGAGLPVPPQTGTGAATTPMTGQESAALADELNRLQAMNGQLRAQKDRLKLDLQEKGRVAGIPPGYLRF